MLTAASHDDLSIDGDAAWSYGECDGLGWRGNETRKARFEGLLRV